MGNMSSGGICPGETFYTKHVMGAPGAVVGWGGEWGHRPPLTSAQNV